MPLVAVSSAKEVCNYQWKSRAHIEQKINDTEGGRRDLDMGDQFHPLLKRDGSLIHVRAQLSSELADMLLMVVVIVFPAGHVELGLDIRPDVEVPDAPLRLGVLEWFLVQSHHCLGKYREPEAHAVNGAGGR